jgi:thiamine biosynthesis protein ThiI
MERVTRVLATSHEICLKGGNRKWFQRKLSESVRRALADLPVASVSRPASRLMVNFSDEVPFTEVARRLATVFGLHSIMPTYAGGRTQDDLEAALAPHLDRLEPTSFRIRALRPDKGYPLTSPELERRIGAFVVARTGWTVDLKHPDQIIWVLADTSGLWFWIRTVPGPGGLPTGVGGRALCLLSGGIDSPVAAWMTMKRGVRVDLVHFHSVPRVDPAGLETIHELAGHLDRFQGRTRLAMVPLVEIQEEIATRCPPQLRIILYRRFMLRIAQKLARRMKCRALVTGESLGQVASQTVENLSSIDIATAMPVLRPLIAFDKQEIVALARRAGTYDLSIEQNADCCSFLMPDRPATRTVPSQLDEAERVLDVDDMVWRAVRATTIHRDIERAPWDRLPIPPEALT